MRKVVLLALLVAVLFVAMTVRLADTIAARHGFMRVTDSRFLAPDDVRDLQWHPDRYAITVYRT